MSRTLRHKHLLPTALIHSLLVLAIIAALFLNLPAQPAQAAVLTATNGIYTIVMDDTSGVYTFGTGTSYPGYPNTMILYDFPGNTYGGSGFAVKSYNTNRVFHNNNVGGDVALGAPASVTLLTGSEVGFESTWNIVDGGDEFMIVQRLIIRGTTVENSRIVVESSITNTSGNILQAGIRSMWDLTLGGNDATPFRRYVPDDPAPSGTFFTEVPPVFSYGEISDPSTINLYVGVNGPAGVTPAPTPPDAFYYADYYVAYPEAWTYAVTGGDTDSVLEYFWGDTLGNALVIPAGESTTVVQVMTANITALLSCVSNGSGVWSEAANWTDCGGDVPDSTTSATIRSGDTITLDQNAVVINLAVNGALVMPAGYTLAVNGSLENNGTLQQTLAGVGVGGATFLNIKDNGASTDKYFGVQITPSADLGDTTVTIQGNQPACTTEPSDLILQRCFHIAAATPVTSSVRFYYTHGELNNNNPIMLGVWRFNPPWSAVGASPLYSGDCDSGQMDCWLEMDSILPGANFALGSGLAPTSITLTSLVGYTQPSFGALLGLLALIMLAGVTLAVLARRKRIARQNN